MCFTLIWPYCLTGHKKQITYLAWLTWVQVATFICDRDQTCVGSWCHFYSNHITRYTLCVCECVCVSTTQSHCIEPVWCTSKPQFSVIQWKVGHTQPHSWAELRRAWIASVPGWPSVNAVSCTQPQNLRGGVNGSIVLWVDVCQCLQCFSCLAQCMLLSWPPLLMPESSAFPLILVCWLFFTDATR